MAAGFGPVTSTAEALSVSIGAGILLGGFGMGALATFCGWEPHRRDAAAVGAGYIVGLLMALVAAAEVALG